MTVIFGGTFADLQKQLSTMRVPLKKHVCLTSETDAMPHDASFVVEPTGKQAVTTEAVQTLLDAVDDEEARDAYRTARR